MLYAPLMEPDTPPLTRQRAKWAWKLFRAKQSDRNGEYQRGLDWLDEAAQIKALYPQHRVLRAKLLLRNQRIQEAQSAFAALRKELEDSEDPDNQYLRHYCSTMLATIRADTAHVRHQAKAAQSIPCSPMLLRRFPLVAGRDD